MYMVYSSMIPTPLHALAAQPHIGSEAARERWDSASSPHVGVIGMMIYRHSDDGAWWRTEGSGAHLGLISFTWVPSPTPPPLRRTSHWVSVSDRYICQSTCWQSRPLTFCTSCGYTRGWIFRLRVRCRGTETPFHGCWRSGSLSAVPPLTMAFAPPNETSRLWFPLETRVPQHSRLDLKGWYPSSHSSKSLSISVLCGPLFIGQHLPCVSFSFSFGSEMRSEQIVWHLEDKFCFWEAQGDWFGILWKLLMFSEMRCSASPERLTTGV